MIFWFIILPIILFFITIHIYKNLIYDFYYYSDIEKENIKGIVENYGNCYC